MVTTTLTLPRVGVCAVWMQAEGTVRGYCQRVLSEGTVRGYCQRVLSDVGITFDKTEVTCIIMCAVRVGCCVV